MESDSNMNQNNETINSEDTNEIVKAAKKQKLDENNSAKVTNVSDLLENELKNLRNNKTKLFYNFETNCKGVIFIKLDKAYKNDLDIKIISKYIIDKVKINKEQISRNISRFIPAEIAFKAKFDLFVKNAPLVLDKYFKKTVPESTNTDERRISWKLEFKSRNNTSINKNEFLDFVLNYIDKNRYYVDYKIPELIVLIEITNDLLCLSVLEDYYENKCYNLMTLSKSEEELKNEREKLMKMQSDRESEKKMLKEKETVEIETSGNCQDGNNIKLDKEDSDLNVIKEKMLNDNESNDEINDDEDDDIKLI